MNKVFLVGLIPDYYLAGHRGFAGLDGTKRLYGLDVVALVSFAYLTIVGAYVNWSSEPGGTDLRHGNTTLIDAAREAHVANLAGCGGGALDGPFLGLLLLAPARRAVSQC